MSDSVRSGFTTGSVNYRVKPGSGRTGSVSCRVLVQNPAADAAGSPDIFL
jgi:hypothetical protein